MPRKLLYQPWFYIKQVVLDDVRMGDLIFVGKNNNDSIDHVMLAISSKQVFHSCTARNTIIEDLVSCLYGEYYPLSVQTLETFRDKRTKNK